MADVVGQLEIKLGFDTKSMDASTKEAESKADNLGKKFTDTGKVIGAAFAAAAAATAAAIGKIAVEATKAYADYEQLTGGVETLFKDSAGAVMEYANNAYKTAGLSANQYMETVTSFSARLLQGLGGDTAEAARIADVAVTDMADNANKMGSSMQSIQDAYQGFAKQNYTMLDNLKLGYGGTATEMARLINDSGVLGDAITVTAETVNNVSFDKMIEAIHVVQGEMGITGTTSLEAADTISGSVNTMKAAWQDMLVSLAGGGQDFGKAMDKLVASAGNVVKNIIPVVSNALTGIADLVAELAPVISAELPNLVATLVPAVVEAATSLIVALSEALPGIVTALTSPENIQTILNAALTLLLAMVDAIPQFLQALTTALPQIITGIVAFLTSPDNINRVLLAAVQLFLALVMAIPQVIGSLVGALGTILSTIVSNIGSWVGQVVAKAVEVGTQFVENVVNFFSQLPSKIGEFLSQVITNVGTWVGEMVGKAVETGTQFLQNIANLFTQLPGKIWEFLTSTIGKVATFVGDMAGKALEAGKMFFDNLVNKITEIPGKMLEIGGNIVKGIWDGISGAAGWLWDQITGFCSSIVDNIKAFFGIESPSKLFRDEVGVYMAQGIGVGFTEEMGAVNSEMQDALASNMPSMVTDASVSVATDDTQIGSQLFTTEEQRVAYVEAMTTFYQQLADQNNQHLANYTAKLNEWVTQTQNKVQEFTKNIISKITQFGQQMVSKAAEIGKNFYTKILEEPNKLPEKFNEIGVNIIKGLEAGMRAQEPALMRYVDGLCAKIVAKMQAAMKIHSPSQVMADEVGSYMAQGVGVGFEEEMKAVSREMAGSLSGTALDGLKGWATSIDLGVEDNNASSAERPLTIYMENNINSELDAERVGDLMQESIRRTA